MNPSISIADRNEKLGKTKSLDHLSSYDPLLEWSGDIDKKWAKEIQLRPGLKLIITDFTFLEDFTLHFDIDRAPLIFCFFLSGKCRSSVNHGLRQEMIIDGKTGTSYISFLPKSRGLSEFSARKPVRMIHIQMYPILLNTFMEGDFDFMPADFRAIAEGSLDKHYDRSGSMIPSIRIALYQMLNCPYHGLTKRLFLESKAVELIALQLEQSVFAKNDTKLSPSLRPADIERIHEARSIVICNMKQPPSLMEIARQVGLNDFKLKIGFRHVFGKTVFGYLYEHRMELSRQLLEDGKMNVKEVSYAVGYMDSGRFSDAFKKQFGVRPSVYIYHGRN